MSLWKLPLALVTSAALALAQVGIKGVLVVLDAFSGGPPTRAERALAQLDLIEAEMRRVGYWKDDPPDLLTDYADGARRSYLDAPTFELWLQVVFLHNARTSAHENTLPEQSQVGLMAMRQYDHMQHIPEAQPLFGLLSEFDAIIEGRER